MSQERLAHVVRAEAARVGSTHATDDSQGGENTLFHSQIWIQFYDSLEYVLLNLIKFSA